MKASLFFVSLFFCAMSLQVAQAQSQRTVQPFDEVVLSGRLVVELVPGEIHQVDILETDIPEDKINISFSGNSLRISTLNRIAKDEEVRLRITYTKLRAIKAQAGVVLTHSGTLTADKLEVRAGSGAEVTIDIQVDALDAYAGEGAKLNLRGSARNQEVSTSSGAEYDSRDLESQRTFVRASAGGLATVSATEFLDASANTGGRILYRGNPTEKYTKSVLGGEISQF